MEGPKSLAAGSFLTEQVHGSSSDLEERQQPSYSFSGPERRY